MITGVGKGYLFDPERPHRNGKRTAMFLFPMKPKAGFLPITDTRIYLPYLIIREDKKGLSILH